MNAYERKLKKRGRGRFGGEWEIKGKNKTSSKLK
jgi:hypothetical protein